MGLLESAVAMPQASYRIRRRAVELCERAGLKVLTVPSYDELVSGRVTLSQLRHIELDDLLGRDPVMLDTGGLQEWLSGRVIMVTGAGGSIGSELARQIARFAPRRLILYDLNEYNLYTIEQEFAEQHQRQDVVCAIGDVKDPARMEAVLRRWEPSVVFHAAAYKHVPLMEDENAWQAVLNNALGTEVLGRAAAAAGVEKFVFISTDKAVNPTNVMGATKRLAEIVCQSLQGRGTQFVLVRFGNVFGSAGSVIPRFREQIARGGPVTVTHREIERYFMSIPEAAQLVLQAGQMGKGGEIFVLDMGEPVKIADLARQMIRLSGFAEADIRIEFTGLRPGEKLYEELLIGEDVVPSGHPRIMCARERHVEPALLDKMVESLRAACDANDPAAMLRQLRNLVPEYRSADEVNAEASASLAAR
jgi:FlaA1/EpsC-like NDP-sugar epimerase